MFATTLKRVSVTLCRGRTNQLFTPATNRFFATNIRDDQLNTNKPGFSTPNQTASKDNAGIGTTQGQNWRQTAQNEPTGGVKNPAKEWASETKDKIREPAGNTAPADAGKSNEWAAPGSAKDQLKDPQGKRQKGSLDAEEKHYVGTAGTEIPKGKKANLAGGNQNQNQDTHGSVHETDQAGRGTTYVGIKGAKPDNTQAQKNVDTLGGTASQYPGEPTRRNPKQNAKVDDAPTSTTGNVQDRNVHNLGKGNKH